ncbi:armadillo-type protein [Lineolata rhizophorae]|uniref:Armadillo-type protein n=1 Tax=Lineolata rhizophorae TaxID=578093 RepID=A0A6A6PAC2_9PEZI|nr:armadillo-type protein [Lineolata rhizophorae]
MAGVKRKQVEADKLARASNSKKIKATNSQTNSKKTAPPPADDVTESDTSEVEHGFYGFSAKDSDVESESDFEGIASDEESEGAKDNTAVENPIRRQGVKGPLVGVDKANTNLSTSSKEAHAKQKALAKERKASKPNADLIQRSKYIWERLRVKSSVPKDERRELVKELFEMITGRVRDFVFKHDSVRVIQCALKYANMVQRKNIAKELKGDYKTLAESKYAKFLVAKLIVEGDDDIRDMIVPEFYGSVRRLINQPEASWILDDIYRGAATPAQKAILLREWYGPEFAIFKTSKTLEPSDGILSNILFESPEKRKPIMSYLYNLINQLIQKKMTGFTMLHDAMLQYYLNTAPGSVESNEFLELLKGDEEFDLLKNLAFTASGAHVVCLAFARGTAKDRKHLLKAYKDTVEMLAYDQHGHMVLVAALDVTDDTQTSTRSILTPLIGKDPPPSNPDEAAQQQAKILALASHGHGRIPLLYPLAGAQKWFFPEQDAALLAEIQVARATTSKKDPQVRRREVVRAISGPVLATIAARSAEFLRDPFACHMVAEVLLEGDGDKNAAVNAVAALAEGDPREEAHIANNAAAGRMLKTLVLGGRFDAESGEVKLVEPRLGFADTLWGKIAKWMIEWACGPSSFVVVNLVDADGFEGREEVLERLRGARARLENAASRTPKADVEKGKVKGGKKKGDKGAARNAGAKILLQKLLSH